LDVLKSLDVIIRKKATFAPALRKGCLFDFQEIAEQHKIETTDTKRIRREVRIDHEIHIKRSDEDQ
jgi:hypothetical protein